VLYVIVVLDVMARDGENGGIVLVLKRDEGEGQGTQAARAKHN